MATKLNEILERIDELKEQIDAHGKISDEIAKRINYKFRLDWNYYSNAMEGNSLTKNETKQVMMDNITISGKPFKDIYEMRGHDDQVLEILKIGKGSARISESRIKEMHKAIMHEDDPENKELIGVWKTRDNHVLKGNRGERIDFLPYEEVPDAIHELLDKTNADIDAFENTKKENKSTLLIAFEFHLNYLTIHPFFDGNGRTGRLLMNLLLIRFGYQPIVLSKNSRDLYYKLLAEVQGAGADPKDFYSFLGKLLIESQQLVLDAIAGKDISEDDDVDKEITLWKQSLDGGDAPLKEKDDLLIAEAYVYSIKPLLELFLKKHEQFDNLFLKRETHNCIGKQWWKVDELEYFDTWAKETLAEREFEGKGLSKFNPRSIFMAKSSFDLSGIGDIQDLILEIRYFNFKKNGPNPFDATNRITLRYFKYKYVIEINNSNEYEKLYSEKFDPDEMISIVNEKTKQFLEKLKNTMKD